MKNTLTLLLLLGISIKTFGQASTKYYLDEFGFPTNEKSNAQSYRIIEKHPVEPKKFLVKEYYLNDTTKQIGTFSDKEIYTKDGFSISFYPNGQKSEEGFYKDNYKVDKWTEWYENGQVKEESFWGNAKDFRIREKVVEFFWDSLGNQLVSKGNGEYIVSEEYPLTHAKGMIKNGLKTGKWNGYFKNGKIAFEEEYEKNRLIGGNSYDSLGQKYKYDEIVDMNLMSFYEFVARNLSYPANARRNGVEGKVIIQILVDTDDKIIKSRIAKGIGGGCDEEALRVVSKYSSNLNRGKKRGQVLKMIKPQPMYLPINFKLG